MSWVDNFQQDNIKPNIVPEEGVYELRIEKVSEGRTQDGPGGKNYIRVETLVNASGFPQLSIFLTEGPRFNGEATAFFNTFNLNPGDFVYDHWIKKHGRMLILLRPGKNGYTNMVPRYILGDDGYVDRKQACVISADEQLPEPKQSAKITEQVRQESTAAAEKWQKKVTAQGGNPELLDESGHEFIF